MLFESVFDSLGEVREVVESGRVSREHLRVNLDKNSVGVFVSYEDEYFSGYISEDYLMAPSGEFEHQCLYYGEFERPQELLVEMLAWFFGGDEVTVEYRGLEERSSHL